MGQLGIGSTVAGYRIVEVLGRGGMGLVYRGVDDHLGRSAAVKVIAPEQAGDAAFRRRFVEESRAAAAIDHPNVLPLYAAGEEDGLLFLVTRMVEGADLATLLEVEGAMGPERALGLVAPIGAALDAAHARGLVHRDVKPANVLVSRDPGSGTEFCYLTDFGLAQIGDRRTRLTSAGQFVGTLDYMAPEQIRGGEIDGRADLYALAALFFECATGEPPFVRDSQPALLFAHLSDPPPPISDRIAGVSTGLDEVVARGLAKAPEERFDSCAAFVAAARAAQDGAGAEQDAQPARVAETVVGVAGRAPLVDGRPDPGSTASPPSSAPPRGKPRRRRWALLAGGFAVLLGAGVAALLALGGGGAGGGDEATTALQLSNVTIALAGRVSEDAGRLTTSVEAAGPTSDLVEAFERDRARAADLDGRVEEELNAGDPGREDLAASARGLREAAASLAVVASAPGAADAVQRARGAKRAMGRAMTGIDRALEALRLAFTVEGEAKAAEEVQRSLALMRGARPERTAPFDELVRAL